VVKRFADKTPFEGFSILFTDSFFCQTEADTKYLRNTILFNDLLSVSQIQITDQISVFAGLLHTELSLFSNKAILIIGNGFFLLQFILE
jgi:hypothetical protein